MDEGLAFGLATATPTDPAFPLGHCYDYRLASGELDHDSIALAERVGALDGGSWFWQARGGGPWVSRQRIQGKEERDCSTNHCVAR
uniref:Uncharacterized protein n=1 Tax=Oryza glumipatula TaxID=40148 RepID=A0A0D9ZWC9_9ORYZ